VMPAEPFLAAAPSTLTPAQRKTCAAPCPKP
jgi:hypothetical protein